MTASDLAPLGWSEHWAALLAEVPQLGVVPGRVMRHDGVRVLVALPEPRSLGMRPNVAGPVVGDWVAVFDDVVVALLPRRSLLRRREAIGDGEQALAANVDAVFVVCGLDRPLPAGRLHRVTALAWDAGAVPIVVLTKADVVVDASDAVTAASEAVPEVDVVVVSAVRGTGLDELRVLARNRTVVLLGESGAGKSTLVNSLVGAEVAATGAVRAGDAKGRHTTTNREIHPLPGGGVLLDSPGIRSVGLWVDPDAIDAVFPDIEAASAGCKFGDCAHAGEPGCGVAAAVESGELPAERVRAWREMRREAEAAGKATEERRRQERRSGRGGKDAARRRRR